MPKAVTIRDVPDDVTDALAVQAAQAGRSLQEHLRLALIEMASRPTMTDVLARIRRRKAAMGSLLAAEEIVEYRTMDQR